MNSISLFNTEPFIDAMKAFSVELNIPISYIADEPCNPKEILEEKYHENNEAHPE